MDQYNQVNTNPIINVGPPSVDFSGFSGSIASKLVEWYPAIFTDAQMVFGYLIGISIVVSFFMIIGIIYCVEQIKFIRKKEELIYDTKVELAYQETTKGDPALGHRWEDVKRLIDSTNQNDWKQAILSADLILDDILTTMGYRGESVGEKLKRVEPADFRTLQQAWEAHKVRNQIAHEVGFNLTHYDANATIGLYRTVFEEFYFI